MSVEDNSGETPRKKRRRGTSGTGNVKSKTPLLDSMCKNITKLANDDKLDPVIGRVKEIDDIITILARRRKNNPLIVGPAGSGKSAIIEGLALQIVKGTAPRTLVGKEIFSLDVSTIVAGTKYRGEFESRMQGLLKELQDNPNIILFIDEIHTLVGAGSANGSLDAANIFKPALARGEIKVIGATTTEEFRDSIEKDAALTRRFQKVTVSEPTVDEAIHILNNIKGQYESYHSVKYTDEAIEACVKLSVRYITDRFLPDKAIDLMDETGAKASVSLPTPKNIKTLEGDLIDIDAEKRKVVKNQQFEKAAGLRDKEKRLKTKLTRIKTSWENKLKSERQTVNGDAVRTLVSGTTGIPVSKMGKDELKSLSNLDKVMKKIIIGQDESIDKIVSAIKVNRIGISNPSKPQGIFMLLGSTGVGKTFFAKTLAKQVFNDDNALIRFDMSEFNESFSVSRFVGAPPGYSGYESGGELTEKVKRKPYSVILFDEIEKAHKDVYNILLQIMDDGHITDSFGTKINFKNTIILMTSNTGVKVAMNKPKPVGYATKSTIADDDKVMRDVINTEMKGTFAPEFINRLDDVLFFNKLTKENITKIVGNEAKIVVGRLLEQGYQVKLMPTALKFLVNEGFDSEFGARPIKRAINRHLEVELATAIVEGLVKVGDTIKVTHTKGSDKLTIKV